MTEVSTGDPTGGCPTPPRLRRSSRPDPAAPVAGRARRRSRGLGRGAVATAMTDDTILVPNLIIVGTFLVPVCTLLFVLSRPREAHLRSRR